MLRQILLVPVASFLVGLLLLGAIGRRPELIDRGRIATTGNPTALGFLEQWRKAASEEEREQIVEAARNAGFNTEQLRAAGRRLGIDSEQARKALAAWTKGMPGYDPAVGAAATARNEVSERRVVGVNPLAVAATTLIGLPPVLVGLGLQRRRRSGKRSSS